MKRYTIELEKEEVEELMSIINKGSHSSHTFRSACILLNCDEGEYSEKVTNEQVSKVLKVGMRTIGRVKKRFMEEGLNETMNRKPISREYKKKVDGDLLDQELVAITMNIPLLDWGQRKGRKEMAMRRKEVAEIEIKQARINFEREVALKVIDFNLQEKLVTNASRADTTSMESYGLTEKRFRMGQADVLKLTTAMQARQQARESYILNLYTYWKNY